MSRSGVAEKAAGKTVEGYVRRLAIEQRKIVSSLIQLVQESAPQARLSIKWAQPVFEQNGPLCYIRAFKNHVNFGFWRGAQIQSGKGILQSGGEKMAHFRILKESDIQRKLFQAWIREAIQLNRTRGDPTREK